MFFNASIGSKVILHDELFAVCVPPVMLDMHEPRDAEPSTDRYSQWPQLCDSWAVPNTMVCPAHEPLPPRVKRMPCPTITFWTELIRDRVSAPH